MEIDAFLAVIGDDLLVEVSSLSSFFETLSNFDDVGEDALACSLSLLEPLDLCSRCLSLLLLELPDDLDDDDEELLWWLLDLLP